MLTVYAAVIGAAVSAVAIILSAVSLALHWLERDKPPQVQELHARCDALQLAQSDMLDRIEHWQRRDRVRRLRDSDQSKQSETHDAPAELSNPVLQKQLLRQRAREAGVLK